MSSEQTYEALVRPIETQMMQSVWRIAQNAEDADDAFQEAAATIWKRCDRIQSHPNPQALILRICVNAACDIVRRRARRIPERSEHRDMMDKSATHAAQFAARGEEQAALVRAISQLPERQATAVSMRYLVGRPYTEIAAALGCSESTARVHVTRGLARLRRTLAHLNPAGVAENAK